MTEPSEKRAQATHNKIEHSARVMQASAVEQVDSADRRNDLAADRTVLAAERTYVAWMRTGLAALAFGIGARALLKDIVSDWLSVSTGCLIVLFGGFCFVAAVWRELLPDIRPQPSMRRLPAWILISVNGFLVLVSLAAFVGLLTIR